MTADPDTGRIGRPLVTFLLFAYNQEKYTRAAIEGAFAQGYAPLEIILSDDCSTDGTFGIMQQMAAAYDGPHRVTARRNPQNLGLAGHINALIALSSGEIVTWAAGDDIALPERTEKLVAAMLAGAGSIAAHSSIIEIDEEGNRLGLRDCSHKSRIDLAEVVQTGNAVVSQSHAFRKEVFDRFGPLGDGVTNEGIVMAFRECALGRLAFVDEPLTLYRIGSGVSTYSGNDLQQTKYKEPVKYTRWYLTAYQQMLQDAPKATATVSARDVQEIKRKIGYYSSLLNVNLGRAVIPSLIANFLRYPGDGRTLRAALRRGMPDWLYRRLMSRS